jgi:hypothetical protein
MQIPYVQESIRLSLNLRLRASTKRLSKFALALHLAYSQTSQMSNKTRR